ncbi:EAL domain-containing protein [Fusobacterium varium]
MPIRKQVLIVDDNHMNRMILKNILSSTYNVIQAENGQKALEILKKEKEKISAIFLDIVMPVMDGYTFLAHKMKDGELIHIPVIVTTQYEDEATEVEALSRGAADFLVKPYRPAIILHRLANIIKMRESSSFINKIEKDSLTGIYNKDFFYFKTTTFFKDLSKKNYYIVFADIERFKLVNDTYGSKEGDRLLKYTADIINEEINGYGICGRAEADHFIICVVDIADIEGLLENISKRVSEFNKNMNIVIHYGIYQVEDRSISIELMCDRAMIAASTVKNKYDKKFAYYDDSIRKKLLQEQMLINDMRTSLAERRFKVFYQPKYDFKTEKIVGVEALVRWDHPKLGMVSPGVFIELFERNGFITEIDYFVWEEACKKLKEWTDNGYKNLSISVNVSRINLYNNNLPNLLIELVKKYNISPKSLHLEITESAYTENSEQIIEGAERLKKIGFIIEMDDFGTGYSSLNMLAKLPIDVLKLDMGFVHSIEKDKNSLILLKVIINLAKELQLAIVAEGVETNKQVNILKNIGCQYAQGYYYSPPISEEKLDKIFIENNSIISLGKTGELLNLKDKELFEVAYSDEIDLNIKKMIYDLKYHSEHDPLTGLLNRRELKERVNKILENNDIEGTFIIIDIDNFKRINDRYGHVKGDEILKEISEKLKNSFSKIDSISRLGGDEFVVFTLGSTDESRIELMMNNFFEMIKKIKIDIPITCSAGICFSSKSIDYDSLYYNADMALLSAKISGKNNYKIYTEKMEKYSPINHLKNVEWVLDQIFEMVFISDAETYEVMYINKPTCEKLGKSREECLGKKCHSLMWKSSIPCERCCKISNCIEKFYTEETKLDDGTSIQIKAKMVEWEGNKYKIHYLNKN